MIYNGYYNKYKYKRKLKQIFDIPVIIINSSLTEQNIKCLTRHNTDTNKIVENVKFEYLLKMTYVKQTIIQNIKLKLKLSTFTCKQCYGDS